ncbi:phage major capsid protein [Paraburkholderia sp. JHI869]|uniref:phage major capsid family protein n=1 Tax=Paraburkholderia sp. JHI869 TaxID=3112959 RepID=UPI00318106D4
MYELTRAARAIALTGDLQNARGFAVRNYGIDAPCVDWLRRAGEILTTQDIATVDGEPIPFGNAGDFVGLVNRRSLIARMSDSIGGGFRAVLPFRPLLLQDEGSTAYWVGEGKLKIVSSDAAFRADFIPVRKCTGLVVASAEFVRKIDEKSDAILQRDLARAVADRVSATFASNAAPDDDQPGGIFSGIEPLASSGDLETDICTLLDGFEGDLGTSCLITTPAIAARINLLGHDQVGAMGGFVAGVACATSDAVADGVLGLVDCARVLLFDGPVVPATSQQATISAEDGDGNTILVSLWQMNLSSVRVEKYCYWRLADPRYARWIGDAASVSATDAPLAKAARGAK